MCLLKSTALVMSSLGVLAVAVLEALVTAVAAGRGGSWLGVSRTGPKQTAMFWAFMRLKA